MDDFGGGAGASPPIRRAACRKSKKSKNNSCGRHFRVRRAGADNFEIRENNS
jgi:hypothetical protein